MKKFTDNVVKYQDARKEIKNGDLLFISESNSFIGKLTEVFTSSPIYHVGIACWMTSPDGEPVLFSAEQWFGGRRLVNLRTFTVSSIVVVENPIKNFHSYSREIIYNTGDDYGNLDFVAAGLKEKFGIKMKNHSGEICSEVILRTINQKLKVDYDPVVSPAKLFEIVTKDFGSKVILQTEIEE